MPALQDKGIPTILTGFALPESNVHSPNERMLVEFFPRGVKTIRELYRRLGDLPSSPGTAPYASPLAVELADDVLERLLRYVRIDTQSAHGANTSPLTEKQLDLSRLLRDELEQIGLDDVRLDEHGYVYGSLVGTEDAPAIGLIAHVDTSPDVTGTDVRPIVHRGYDGGVLELPGDPSVVLDPAELPLLTGKIGHDLVTTDGTTLLGADDKAGVAEIMAAVAYLKRNPVPACADPRLLHGRRGGRGRSRAHRSRALWCPLRVHARRLGAG